jgi:hypothetical protein
MRTPIPRDAKAAWTFRCCPELESDVVAPRLSPRKIPQHVVKGADIYIKARGSRARAILADETTSRHA